MKKSPQKKKKTATTRKSRCLALIPLDTKKIIAEQMKVYNRRKKVLERLEVQIASIVEKDEPEYQKFLARNFGAEQTRQREIQSEIFMNQTRYEKIRFMASEKRMRPDRYCYVLSQNVTDDHDFWHLLDEEIEKYRQEELEREKKETMYREKMRNKSNSDSTEDWQYEDDPESMWDRTDEFDDPDDEVWFDDFDKEFEKILNKMFGIPDSQEMTAETQKELKKLYRELCLKYHPDKVGKHDARLQRIWNEIQSAYEDADIDRLRSIYFDCEMKAGKRDLCSSEIDELILNVQRRINVLRDELFHQKKTPFYGFSVLNEVQKNELEKRIRKDMTILIQEGERQLSALKNKIDKVLHGWKPKTKMVKKTKEDSQNDTLEQMDLFSF